MTDLPTQDNASGTSPQTHDYTRGTWGLDYSTTAVIDGGMRLRLVGWGTGIQAGGA